MSDYPSDLRYSTEHEWVKANDNRWRVGITKFAANQLGDIVVAELPKVGTSFTKGDDLGTLESVKAVSVLYAPVSGRVTAINQDIVDDPEPINLDPYGEGWLIELEPSSKSELDELLTADVYAKRIASEDA